MEVEMNANKVLHTCAPVQFAWLIVRAAILLTFLVPGASRADSVGTYRFFGSLTNFGSNGTNGVSGQFTLDTTDATITAFDFFTPIGDISASAGWTPFVETFTPALDPAADFVVLNFRGGIFNFDFMNLVFETSLPAFSGLTFYSGVVTPSPSAILESVIQCGQNTTVCSDPGFHSTFASGIATPLSVPEPSSLPLLCIGLLGVVGWFRHSFSRRLRRDAAQCECHLLHVHANA